MIGLIQNEMIKIFRRPGTYVMLSLLLIVITIAGVTMKYNLANLETNDPNWKENLQTENVALAKQMEQYEKVQPELAEDFRGSIARNKYRIEHDLPPLTAYTIWDFVSDISEMIDFIGIFVITIAAGIVASEFNWGTIKLLLIRPINRAKILTSKYFTVLVFGIFMLVVTFLLSGILGAILFGFPDKPVPYLLYRDGMVSEVPIILYLIVYYSLKSINMVLLVTMAFMMSTVFRNSSLAIGLSIFLMFTGGNVTQLLAAKYDWAKYILFANTNLLQYFEGAPMIEGMTLTFSIIMLLLYLALFLGMAYYVFKKRDIAA